MGTKNSQTDKTSGVLQAPLVFYMQHCTYAQREWNLHCDTAFILVKGARSEAPKSAFGSFTVH